MITSSVEVDTVEDWVRTVVNMEEKMSDMEAIGKIISYEVEMGLTPNSYYVKIAVDMPEDGEL